MRRGLELARLAAESGEVPIGCVLVSAEGHLLGQDHNRVESLQDPTAHAEVLAISAAAHALGSRRLNGAVAYVTTEPCAMCMGAFYLARVDRVVFGTRAPKFGACGSRLDLTRVEGLNHTLRVEGGLLAEESAELLRDFFRSLRGDSE